MELSDTCQHTKSKLLAARMIGCLAKFLKEKFGKNLYEKAR